MKLEVWDLDLSSYDSVVAFGKRVCTELQRLDAFIANAGIEVQTFQMAENVEKHLTVNVVSCFMSAIACLPLLRKTSKNFDVQTTLTFCGSMYHIFGHDDEFDAGLSDDADMFNALSDSTRTDIIWRYALSKLMVHQCFHELVAHVDQDVKHTDARVVVNIVNPGWCGTELSRAKPSNLGEKFCFALMGWTAEKGSRVYLHALAAGKSSHGQYLSEGSSTVESQYVRSDRGRRIQAKMWKDLVIRMTQIAPEVAGLVS
jgi:retinol dehydrogenase-12